MDIITLYFVIILILAIVFGFSAQRSQLCPVGGLREGINGQGWHRLATYFIVIATALLATNIMEFMELVQLNDTKPPYRSSQLAWGRYVIGGFVFGFGMVLASGCGMRNLVRLGQGSLKALVLLMIMSITAYIMTRTSVYADYFMPWLTPMTIDLSAQGNQTISTLLFGSNNQLLQLITAVLIAFVMLGINLRNTQVKQGNDWIHAVVIGLVVTASYWITSGNFGQQLAEQAEFIDPPLTGIGSQSFTFAAPMGDITYWLMQGMQTHLMTFGVVAIMGMILGSLIASLLNKAFSVVMFGSIKEFAISGIGAILVAIGAVVAMGCSIGHGVTGIATLATGSFMALGAIGLGAYTGLWVEKRYLIEKA